MAVVDFAVPISASVLIAVLVDLAVSVFGLSVIGSFCLPHWFLMSSCLQKWFLESLTVLILFSVPLRRLLPRLTWMVSVTLCSSFVFLWLVVACATSGQRDFLPGRSDICQSSEVSVRPRGLFVFNSAGMNPPEKSFVLFCSSF